MAAIGIGVNAADSGPVIYVSQGGTASELWRIDPLAQTVNLVGAIGFDRVSGLDFDSSGVLYGVSGGSGGPASLITINHLTGLGTLVGEIGGIQGADGLAFAADGTLYSGGWNGTGRLLTLNPANGSILTNIQMFGSGNSFVAGLDFDASGQLWASRGNAGGSTEDILKINTTTGVHTAVGGDTAVISGIWFAADGTMYAGATNGDLFTVNTTTGAQTFLFNTGIGSMSGMAGLDDIQAVPEPSTLALAGIGLMGLLAARHRRNRARPGAPVKSPAIRRI